MVDAPVVAAYLDQMRVRQVLDNLIDNALRHTPPGGTITLAAHNTGDSVQISIRDTGCGFTEPGQLARDLDRDADSWPGRGLGLRIAQTVTASHGGRLMLANREPNGAMVTLRFTSAAIRPNDAAAASTAQDGPAETPRKRLAPRNGVIAMNSRRVQFIVDDHTPAPASSVQEPVPDWIWDDPACSRTLDDVAAFPGQRGRTRMPCHGR